MLYRIEVTGEWGGTVGGWRPAITGTLNQTGGDDEWASTCVGRDTARAMFDAVILPQLPEDDNRFNGPRFRIVDLETGNDETR
jgi:hypothetical protein